MNVRLIKPGVSVRGEKIKQPPIAIPIIDTVRSWVREFQSTKADRTRLDFERLRNLGNTATVVSGNYYRVK